MGNVVAASAGGMNSMALRSDGSLWVWGDNGDVDFGEGVPAESQSPVKIMENINAISAGGTHSMAVAADGSLWAWGQNGNGQRGSGDEGALMDGHFAVGGPPVAPAIVLDNVASVFAGNTNTFAVRKDGSLWAWGVNFSGELGDGTTDQRNTPVKIMDGVMLPN